MVDDEYRRTPPDDHEWPGFWRMKKEFDEYREVLAGTSSLISALVVIRKSAPYAVIIGMIVLGVVNSDSLRGLIP